MRSNTACVVLSSYNYSNVSKITVAYLILWEFSAAEMQAGDVGYSLFLQTDILKCNKATTQSHVTHNAVLSVAHQPVSVWHIFIVYRQEQGRATCK